jgi:hypothetical protein
VSTETPEVISTEAVLEYYDLAPTAASVTVRTHDRRARILRALRVLGICWGLAAVSVLIPIAHFLLVPAFFLAGPALAIPKLKESATVLSARGPCPACGAQQEFSVNSPVKERMPLSCGACRRGLRLVVARAP